jgi:cathepsin F
VRGRFAPQRDAVRETAPVWIWKRITRTKPIAGTCEESKKTNGSRSSAARTTISGFGLVSQNETQIAAALVKHGPLSIGIDAAWMQTYAGGVACPWLCDKNALDHGVLIVGYDGDGKFAPVRLHKEPYWIIKNSWGQDWGHEGLLPHMQGQRLVRAQQHGRRRHGVG